MSSRYFTTVAVVVITITPLITASYGGNNYYRDDMYLNCFPPPGGVIPTRFPLSDNFPNTELGSAESINIVKIAGGIPPNTQLPASIAASTVTSIRLAMQYEFYAIAALTAFRTYIEENKPGFSILDSEERAYALKQLESQIAQAEIHGITSRNFLLAYGLTPEEPCQYQLLSFTSPDYTSSIFTSALVGEIYLGFAKTSIQKAAQAGDFSIIPIFVSVFQNVAQRVGVLRSILDFVPCANPFPLTLTEVAAYTELVNYLAVPGSCPNVNLIDLQVYSRLYAVNMPQACGDVDQVVEYRIGGQHSLEGYYMGYNNQENLPVLVPVQNVQSEGDCTSFEAVFPCSLLTFGQGFTAAGLVNSSGPFVSAEEASPYITNAIYPFYLS